MGTTAHETQVIGSTQQTLRRLARVTREAGSALKELERAGLGDVLGRYTLEPGEEVDEEEVISFLRQVLLEHQNAANEGLEILVKTNELRAPGGAESGSHERIQRRQVL